MNSSVGHQSEIRSVAIIGAGMAGISCALSLSVEIPNVTVFEANDFAGGRMASIEDQDYQYDHGAQFFSVGSEAFTERVEEWKREWLIDEWPAWVVDLQKGKALSREQDVTRYVSRPMMGSLLTHLSAYCDIEYGRSIQALKKAHEGWRLLDQKHQSYGPYDVVVLAVPAPVAASLIVDDQSLQQDVAAVDMTSCWSVVLGFEQALDLGYDAAHVIDSSITWIARNNSKHERPSKECWVIHALGEWSDQHAELDETTVTRQLFEAFKAATGTHIKMPEYAKAYYWPYALAVNAMHGDSLYNKSNGLGVCGDWCVSPRVEGAFLSGLSVAQRILDHNDS